MLLVNSNSLLKEALKGGYAIGAYNINNLEWTKYILEACQEDKAPVILGVTPSAIKYFGGFNVVFNMVKSLIKDLNITIPVVLHLDHGKSFLDCKNAIDAGFTSVMLDASNLSLEENIKNTNEVIDYAKSRNVSVEAEIGSLDENDITDVSLVNEFYNRTNVDSLAPSVGNKHGIYKDEIKLEFEILGEISKDLKIPLVLHGASGLDDNKIKTAIFCGISKINVNTDFQIAFSQAVRGFLDYNKEEYDPRKIIGSTEKNIKKVVHQKNELFGSKNKAN